MATYAIGDIQGCYDALQRLLEKARFDAARDRLWFAGDLVNRGPDSLAVLRFVSGLGDAAVTVLGNHDIHLLCRASEIVGAKKRDTLDQVVDAPDGGELVHWLRTRPLMHYEAGYVLVHAGLLPQWSIDESAVLAGETSRLIRSDEGVEFLRYHVGHNVARWPDRGEFARLSFVLNVLTRLRICTGRGEMEFSYSGPFDGIPNGFHPWFALLPRELRETVLFGHWAALGFHTEDRAICLDSGCVWGGSLTALRLEDRQVFQVPCDASK